jgi:hypothetical protein
MVQPGFVGLAYHFGGLNMPLESRVTKIEVGTSIRRWCPIFNVWYTLHGASLEMFDPIVWSKLSPGHSIHVGDTVAVLRRPALMHGRVPFNHNESANHIRTPRSFVGGSNSKIPGMDTNTGASDERPS